jgi:hypothetical protein
MACTEHFDRQLIGEATVRSVATQALKTLMGEQATLVPMPVR